MREHNQKQAQIYKQKTDITGAPHVKKKPTGKGLEDMNLDRRSEDSGIQNIYDPFAKKVTFLTSDQPRRRTGVPEPQLRNEKHQ